MTTRLPLRVEPISGEWWRSYLLRVAALYGVHPFNVVERVHGLESVDRRHLRWTGIAMSDSLATEVGMIINLSRREVQSMHLNVFDGSALRFSGQEIEAFDPARAFEAGRLPSEANRLFVRATRDRYCAQCVDGTPGYRAVSWRLKVHLVCVLHRELLIGAGESAREIVVDGPVVASQNEVLKRLRASDESAAFFEHLHAQLSMANGRWRQQLERSARAAPEEVLETFNRAVVRVLSPGYPDHQGYASWPPVSAAKHLRAPEGMGYTGPPCVFPHLLPMAHFTGGLSDLLHRAQIRQARAIAAAGAQMTATGVGLDIAVTFLPKRRRATTKVLFLKHLIQLEREGRAEIFWDLCTTAATAILQEGVDYRLREDICMDEDAHLAAKAAEPNAYPRTIRTWLVDQWACTYTSSNVRPSVRDGSIETFDRIYGAGMREALTGLVQRRAA